MLGRQVATAKGGGGDPSSGDALYEAYSNLLLERTRNTKTFRLLFEELISYRFRRNLLGIRPLGFPLCALCLIVELGLLVRGFRSTGDVEATKAVFAVLDGFLVACWWLVITPGWVRRAADAYAERLLAASENLKEKSGRAAASEKSPLKNSASKRSGRRGE